MKHDDTQPNPLGHAGSGIYSACHKVLSGIPQGFILGAILFVIYMNDLAENNHGFEIYVHTDDAKVFKHILNHSHIVTLQDDDNKLKDWSDRCL
jgi:ribonucleases P/MRP protein subunit RPP40